MDPTATLAQTAPSNPEDFRPMAILSVSLPVNRLALFQELGGQDWITAQLDQIHAKRNRVKSHAGRPRKDKEDLYAPRSITIPRDWVPGFHKVGGSEWLRIQLDMAAKGVSLRKQKNADKQFERLLEITIRNNQIKEAEQAALRGASDDGFVPAKPKRRGRPLAFGVGLAQVKVTVRPDQVDTLAKVGSSWVRGMLAGAILERMPGEQ